MKTMVKSTALVLVLVFIHACSGKATMPHAEPTSPDPVPRGYGEQPEDQVAGAVSSLGSEEESGGTFNTMVEMLRGRVPGLQISEGPGGEINVRIRGDQSFYFNQAPLLVVDGVSIPSYSFSSTLRSMNPQEVRSIRVLKDAGSTSSYGTRGAHGVILISLKRG